MDQPGKVANPARGQLNRENIIPLSPCVPDNLVSRDGFSRPVPRQPAHLHSQAESGAYLRDSSRVPRRCVYIACSENQNAAQIGRLSPADHERDRPPCTSTQNVRSKLSLQPMITCGMLRRSRCIHIFFKQQQQKALWHLSPCVGCSEGPDAFRFTKKTAL